MTAVCMCPGLPWCSRTHTPVVDIILMASPFMEESPRMDDMLTSRDRIEIVVEGPLIYVTGALVAVRKLRVNKL